MTTQTNTGRLERVMKNQKRILTSDIVATFAFVAAVAASLASLV